MRAQANWKGLKLKVSHQPPVYGVDVNLSDKNIHTMVGGTEASLV